MDEYIQYDNEWEREVMKNSKAFIVEMLRRVAQERDDLRKISLAHVAKDEMDGMKHEMSKRSLQARQAGQV